VEGEKTRTIPLARRELPSKKRSRGKTNKPKKEGRALPKKHSKNKHRRKKSVAK